MEHIRPDGRRGASTTPADQEDQDKHQCLLRFRGKVRRDAEKTHNHEIVEPVKTRKSRVRVYRELLKMGEGEYSIIDYMGNPRLCQSVFFFGLGKSLEVMRKIRHFPKNRENGFFNCSSPLGIGPPKLGYGRIWMDMDAHVVEATQPGRLGGS